MTTKVLGEILGSAIGLAMIASSATLPAQAQFANYPIIIVPPPAQNYGAPKPDARAQTATKPKPPPSAPDSAPIPSCRYQGQTRVCD